MHRNTGFTSFFLVVVFLFLYSSLFAQMSDQDVVSEALKYKSSGMTQEQVLRELVKKGVTTTQLQRIKEVYESGTLTVEQSSGSGYGVSTGNEREATEVYTYRQVDKPAPTVNDIYGQDFFSTNNLTFAPNMNMPTPANYVLGPGDEVLIDVWGDSQLNLSYKIAPDGFIFVPGIGRIQLSGVRVDQATTRIKNAFSSIYSDLDSPEPHTFLAISVGNLRSIQVNVMGEVRVPGTYRLSSFSSVFHALYSAGGINDIGSLRNIRVFRNGKVAATVDIYDYLMKGDNSGDMTLQDGDIVKVDPYLILAQIKGEVKRPMRYEMRPNETLKDLIAFAGGFKGEAYKEHVELNRKGDAEMEVFTVRQVQYPSFRLKDGDGINVGNILDKYSNMVEIEGAVNRPGKYAVGDGIKTVKDLVNIAGGTTGDAFLYRVILDREKEDLTRIVESIDLDALLNNRVADVPLRKNDRLYIPSVLDLNESRTVFIGGEVRNPGSYPFADNMSIEDLILRAGGFEEAASLARIDVYRRIKDPVSTQAANVTGETFSFSIKEGLMASHDKSFTLEPYDQVVVRKSPSYEVQQNVTVEGEVLFEGQYAKIEKSERLSSFIKRAGGLTPQAYVKGARLTRQLTAFEQEMTRDALKARARIQTDSAYIDNIDLSSQYVGIDLEKALKNPGKEDDIILRQGDVLTVPQYNGTVKISGGVMYPNIVTYKKGMRLSSYISQAGGYSRLAMKTKPFVIYMNGKVATGYWAKIEPGCEIIVPEKPDREPMSIQGLLSITTSITTIALLVSNLVK